MTVRYGADEREVQYAERDLQLSINMRMTKPRMILRMREARFASARFPPFAALSLQAFWAKSIYCPTFLVAMLNYSAARAPTAL